VGKTRRFICVLLAFIFAVGLLPPSAVYANFPSAGLNLHAPFSESIALNPNGIGLSPNNPYQTNQSHVTISGTPVGIDPYSITYRVTKVGTSQMYDGTAPIVQGSDFYFHDVPLFLGLNKIELLGRVGGSMTTMEERYVYFYNSPSISGLEVIGATNVPVVNFEPRPYTGPADFANSRSVFDAVMKLTARPITIQGNFRNANSIDLEGQPAALFGSQFMVNASNAGIAKGEYNVTFTVRNDSASMQYPYNIAVNNGEPMVLDVRANMDSGDVKLDQLRTVTLNEKFYGNSNDFVFSAYLFVDASASLSRVDVKLQRIADEVITEDSKTILAADLANFPVLDVPNKYKVYYLGNIRLDGGFNLYNNPGSYRLLFETYDNQVPAQVHPTRQIFRFDVVNENLPYIRSVTQDGVSLSTDNLISRIGQHIVVEVGGTATSVSLTSSLLSTSYNPATQAPTKNGNKFTFVLDNLQPGPQLFTFVASDGTNTHELKFYVEAVLVPTLKLYGINEGQVFNTMNVPMVVAEYVNFPNPADRASTRIWFNGVREPDPYDANNAAYFVRDVSGGSCTGCITADSFAVSIKPESIVQGRNVLKFELTNGTVTSVVELSFYYLADDAPYIFASPEPKGKYTETQYDDTYTTTEQYADFVGTLSNGSYVVVRKNGTIVAERQLVGSTWQTPTVVSYVPEGTLTITDNDSGGWDFELRGISLIGRYADGTLDYTATTAVTFEIYKIAKDQAPSSIFTVTIERLLAPYEPTELTRDFLEKGVINRNYLPFTIDTDGAVLASVNKIPMERIPHPDPNSNRTRFHLDVPLKKGNNKLKIEIMYPNGSKMTDEVQILSADVHQPGAAYKDSLGKKTNFTVFEGRLELEFGKNTLVRQANPNVSSDGFAKLYNEVPMFFGIAQNSTGLVLEENSDKRAAINLMQARLRVPYGYALASPLYWIDAGQIEDLTTLDVKGGVDPFGESGGQTIINRTEDRRLEPTKAGTLTIKYDPVLRNAATPLLTVMYHDGQQWYNLGGVVSSKKGEISVPFRRFGYYAVMRMDKSLNDIILHPWARDDIEILKARGWMRELSPNAFGTETIATRGELATLLVKSLDIDLDYKGEMTFADVPEYSADPQLRWDYKYIETAARVGIVRGGRDNLFRPNDPISRQDAAVMIARAMNMKLNTYDKAKAKASKEFRDWEDIDVYALPSVMAVYQKGIMTGQLASDGETVSFAPKSTLTRAESASITVRILKGLKRIEK